MIIINYYKYLSENEYRCVVFIEDSRIILWMIFNRIPSLSSVILYANILLEKQDSTLIILSRERSTFMIRAPEPSAGSQADSGVATEKLITVRAFY